MTLNKPNLPLGSRKTQSSEASANKRQRNNKREQEDSESRSVAGEDPLDVPQTIAPRILSFLT
jgi:hypothetical protein